MTISETTISADQLREFNEMWDAQLLDYPTISRAADGTWDYFDVRPLGDAKDWDTQIDQGEELAFQTLLIAGKYREADSCALDLVFDAAAAILRD